MNKKRIDWIEKIIKLIGYFATVVLGLISIYKKSWLVFFVSIIAVLLLTLFYFLYSSHKEKKIKENFKKENKRLKRVLKEKDNKIQILQGNMCKDCRKIYSYYYPDDEWISFSEKPNENECFSLIKEMSEFGEMSVHHLDNEWIFFNFWEREDESYLIDLIGKLIYLPISEWEESKRDCLLSYKILCSKRKNHFGIDEIDKFI